MKPKDTKRAIDSSVGLGTLKVRRKYEDYLLQKLHIFGPSSSGYFYLSKIMNELVFEIDEHQLWFIKGLVNEFRQDCFKGDLSGYETIQKEFNSDFDDVCIKFKPRIDRGYYELMTMLELIVAIVTTIDYVIRDPEKIKSDYRDKVYDQLLKCLGLNPYADWRYKPKGFLLVTDDFTGTKFFDTLRSLLNEKLCDILWSGKPMTNQLVDYIYNIYETAVEWDRVQIIMNDFKLDEEWL